VTLDVPERLPVSEFRDVLSGLTDLVGAFSDFGRLPEPEPPTINLALGTSAKSTRRESSSELRLRKQVRFLQRRTADDLRILSLSYGSPVEIILLASGASATVLLTWFGVATQWGNVRAKWAKNEMEVARAKMEQTAFELVTEALPAVVHDAVQTNRLAEVLATVTSVSVLEPGDAGRQRALPPSASPPPT